RHAVDAPPSADAAHARRRDGALPRVHRARARAHLRPRAAAQAEGRAGAAASGGVARVIARFIADRFLRRIGTGRLVLVEAGDRRVYGSGSPAATVHARSPRVWRKLLRGSRGLAESY